MSKRFASSNAEMLCEHFRTSGMDENAHTIAPTVELHGGCSDPGCCKQHSGVTVHGEPMLTVKTHVSGAMLHRMAATMGLLN